MSDKEVSELDDWIKALERVEAEKKAFWVSPGNIARLLYLIRSELHTQTSNYEALEAKYEQLEKRVKAVEDAQPMSASINSPDRQLANQAGHHLEINRGKGR